MKKQLELSDIVSAISTNEAKLIEVNERLRRREGLNFKSPCVRNLLNMQQDIMKRLIALYNSKEEMVKRILTFKKDHFERLCSEEGISKHDLEGETTIGEIIELAEEFDGAEVKLDGEWFPIDFVFPCDGPKFDAIRIR